ncbi:GSCOCG00009504001-RA-CDS [Cotesia congregata]|nr:GSCOCG00009504001-RA-CDS [Cotesia congregata]
MKVTRVDLGLSGPVVTAIKFYWPAKSQVTSGFFYKNTDNLLRQRWGFYAACALLLINAMPLEIPKVSNDNHHFYYFN